MSEKDQTAGSLETSTLFSVPDRCVVELIDSDGGNRRRSSAFSLIRLHYTEKDETRFSEIAGQLRRSCEVHLAHIPNLLDIDDQEDMITLAVMFYESDRLGHRAEDPLLAALVAIDNDESGREILGEFRERVLSDGYFALSVDLDSYRTFLYLVDINAVYGVDEEPDFDPVIPPFAGEPVYFAEFAPPVKDIITPMGHALEHYKNHFYLLGKKGIVDLTGLVPDGLA